MAIDDQLAVLLAQNAELFATYEEWANGQIMLLAGTIDDPASFNVQGGKAGALGYYPVVNVSGQTIYVPCMARLAAIAREVPEIKIVNTAFLAAPGDQIVASTAGGSFVVTLPAAGGDVTVSDGGNTWGAHPVTISGNGRTIDGESTLAVDASGYSITFTSVGGAWRYALNYQYGV